MLHGIEGILQEPRFHWYLLVPGIIFFFDRLMTLRRAKSEVPVLSFRLLQSDVTELRMYRKRYDSYRMSHGSFHNGSVYIGSVQ